MKSLIDVKKIPREIIEVSKKITDSGFEAYLVGGCVRDLLLKRKPKDWDLTTDAYPEQIQAIFKDSFYENDFGTVGIKTNSDDPCTQIVEVTPYRLEIGYDDKRHPNKVIFSKIIDEDLKRRDFTINAMAYDINKGHLKDIFKGQKDLERSLIRAVGNPDERFCEDALRMLRAVRFSSELDFIIENETSNSIAKNAELIKYVSQERIGEEFKKIVMSKNPAIGLGIAQKLGILKYFLPDFEKTVGVSQNKQAHKYDVWEHLLRSLQHAADKNYSLEVRLAALFHDISKPTTKKIIKGQTTFYNHEVFGAKVSRETLRKMAFPKNVVDKVEKLVRYHMFFADTEQITHSAVRRLVQKVGHENIWDLMNLRICDRIGTGRPKEEPYRLRKYQAMIEEVIRDPVSVSMLKIDGKKIIDMFHEKPGPKIGYILHALLEEVLENPKKNNEMFLVKHTEELLKLSDNELKALGQKGKEFKKEKDIAEITKIRNIRGVK